MSHTTSINSVPIRDLAALRAAVERLKSVRGVDCELLENAKPRMYYREQEKTCDFVLHLNGGRYDVGFQKQPDGSYTPIYDEFNGYVGHELQVKATACPLPKSGEERALAQIGMFSQEYARCSAVNAASEAGFYVESESLDETGAYQMVLAQ